MNSRPAEAPVEPRVLAARIVIAAIQAAVLYALAQSAARPPGWPATQPAVFEPLLLAFVFVPLLAMVGLGQLRAVPLAAWTAAASMAVAALALHDALRGQAPRFEADLSIWPSAHLCVALAAALFVAHVLVVDSLAERRLRVSYARHFDTAWKAGLQALLAAAFVGLFWAVLALGAGLFKLVRIEYFVELIQKRGFAIPATTLALAVAIHASDVQPALIRGTRAVGLALFSWLLPLLAVILSGFLASLPFISLAPLWSTHFATALLLVSAALLVFLINSAYQDGSEDGGEATRSRIKRAAAVAGALELAPLVALAGYALALRVGQYGWTVDRVLAAACVAVMAGYAIGYAVAALRPGAWMRSIEAVNPACAYLFLLLVLALFTPIADPARLMVASQLARLQSGAVSTDKFDFVSMKFDGARWGAQALQRLAAGGDGPEAAKIATAARDALARSRRWSYGNGAATTQSADELLARIAVYPHGRSLPRQFAQDVFDQGPGPGRPFCTASLATPCSARFIELKAGQPEAVVLVDSLSTGRVFEPDAQGHWTFAGTLRSGPTCGKAELWTGELQQRPHEWPDLVTAGGHRFEIVSTHPGCGQP